MNELFNPELSAQNLKAKVLNWNTLTLDIVEELSNARKFYSSPGFRSDRTLLHHATRLLTWQGYCLEVGIDRTTAHRWLERYLPEEHKLLTPEELEDKKAQEENAKREASKSAYQKSLDRVVRYRKTGVRGEGWGATEDKLLQEDIARDKRFEEAKQRTVEKEKQEKEEKARDQEGERLTEDLFSALDANTAKWKERRDFKEAIRVSSEGQDDPFVDAIMDYLDTLENDNRKIEACQNIIKVCKRIAADLQRS